MVGAYGRLSSLRGRARTKHWVGLVWALAVPGCYEGATNSELAPADAGGSDDGADTDGGTDGDGDPDLPEVGCDGLRPGRAPLRRMSDAQYRNTIDDLFGGAVTASEDFPPTSSAFAFSNAPDANLVTDLAAEQILMAAEDVGEQVMAGVDEIAPCPAGADALSCAETFVAELGPRAFRRPLRDEERTLLLDVYAQAAAESTYPDAIGRVVTVLLQMPGFLYFIEEGRGVDGDVMQLTDHEVATRLSYLLWDTMPDEELAAAADAGELATPEQIEVQARRLLADPRAAAALTRFHREWLGIRRLRAADKDVEAFPGFGPELIAAMDEQLERFVADTYLGDDSTLSRLFTSREVEIDASLAALYGMQSPGEWTSVELDSQRRAGIFTLPAYLAAHATNRGTSAVGRGLQIRTRVLCQPIPPPPPGAMAMGAELPEDASEVEKTQALLDNPECGTCHILMNPLGMGFEHYDAVGAWRETYEDGAPIETRWDLVSPPAGLEESSFDGAVELVQLLAGSEPVGECFVSNWTHHTFGVPVDQTEVGACTLEELTSTFNESGQDLSELVVAVTQTDAFRFRDLSSEEN